MWLQYKYTITSTSQINPINIDKYIHTLGSTSIVRETDCKDSLRSPLLSGSCMFCNIISEHFPPSCTWVDWVTCFGQQCEAEENWGCFSELRHQRALHTSTLSQNLPTIMEQPGQPDEGWETSRESWFGSVEASKDQPAPHTPPRWPKMQEQAPPGLPEPNTPQQSWPIYL